MTFRDEMPDVAYLHCPRCGTEFVEIPLTWTIAITQMHDGVLNFDTSVTTRSVRHSCPGIEVD